MKIKNSEIDYGKLVFLSRIKNELTQQELSFGICSITYLSKVENSKIVPNKETLTLLLERLDIDINKVFEENFYVINEMEKVYLAIIQREKTPFLDQLMQRIDEEIHNIYSPDLTFYYYLLKFRYSVYKKMIKEAESVLNILLKTKEKLTEHQNAYFEYFSGLYYCTIKSDLPRGLEHLINIKYFFNIPENEDPDFFYHLSLTYTNTHNTRMAVTNVEKALAIFNKRLLIKRSLECQLLLGVNLGRISEYSNAIETFQHIVNVAPQLEEELILAKALHNLGYIHSKMKKYEDSVNYYLKTLDYIKSPSELRLNVVIELSRVLQETNQNEEALKWVELALMDIEETPWASNKIIQLEVIKRQMTSSKNELIDYLEQEAIPLFIETNDIGLLSQYYEMLGELYKQLYQYKKSSYYYEQCLYLNKKMS